MELSIRIDVFKKDKDEDKDNFVAMFEKNVDISDLIDKAKEVGDSVDVICEEKVIDTIVFNNID